ncbi:MAG: thioredoxin family protein [Saprospiraceae bacterium]
MKWYTYSILSCFFLFLVSACAPAYYNPIVVRPASCSRELQFAESPSLGYLLAFADKMEKPVFLDFYAPWIPNCKRMDEIVFKQGALASYFNQNFVNYKVNAGGASPGPELTDMYGVTSFPTFIFVDGKGKVMKRHEGYVTADQLLEMGFQLRHEVDEDAVSLGTK